MSTGRDVEKLAPHSALPQDTDPSSETLRTPPRLLIYGSRIAGSFDLAELLDSTLRENGITEATVDANRFVEHIEDAFFNRNRVTESVVLETKLAAIQLPRRRFLVGLGRALLWHPTNEVAAQGELPRIANTADQPISIPTAVFVFPEMRARYGNTSTTVDTPYELIDTLCASYDIPVIRVERDSIPAKIADGVRQITA